MMKPVSHKLRNLEGAGIRERDLRSAFWTLC